MLFKRLLKKTRSRLCCFCLAAFLVTSSASAMLQVSASDKTSAPISPGIFVLAEQNSMAMAGLRGNSIKFDADDFCRALNLARIDKITVTSAPAVTDGELRVGSTVVNSGQTVSAANLSLLSYTASSGITTSSFRFRADDSPYEMTCKLYLLDRMNYAPTLSMVPKTSL